MSVKFVEAHEVRSGDYLTGLDNGYVFEQPVHGSETQISLGEGSGYPHVLPEATVLITFHTANGDEAYLICPDNMPITVERP